MKEEIKCCQCLKVITGDGIFSFSGGFACENCVRNYYSDSTSDVVELELKERGFLARRILGRKHFDKVSDEL